MTYPYNELMRTVTEDQEKKKKKKSDQRGGNGMCFSKVNVESNLNIILTNVFISVSH